MYSVNVLATDRVVTIGTFRAPCQGAELLAMKLYIKFASRSVFALAMAGLCVAQQDPLSLDNALLDAVRHGQIPAADALLRQGANIEAKDKTGATPLNLALNLPNASMLKLLLDKGANVEAKAGDGESILANAARDGRSDFVAALLPRVPNPEARKEALFEAIRGGAIPVIEIQVPEGEHVPVPPTPSQPELSPCAKVVELLLQSGVPIEAKEEDGSTPLITAAEYGNTEIVKLLLDKGADIAAKDNVGMTALVAAGCECPIIDMPATYDSLKLLLEHGADIEANANDGTTALMAAAGWGRTENAKLLLDSGANIEVKDKAGDTALLIASKGSAYPTAETVELLVERHTNIEARNRHSQTALMLAASGGGYEAQEIVKLLLRSGADPNAKNSHGDTAMSLALKSGHPNVVRLLQSRP